MHHDLAKVKPILDRYPCDESSLVMVLQDVQEQFHYLPCEALEQVARELRLPRSRVFSAATFYKVFSLEPQGRTIIQVCKGTACHVRGAQLIEEELARNLGVAVGETTEDLGFTLPGLAERIDHGAFALRAVAVDARDAALRESLAQRVFEPLRSLAQRPDDFPAFRTLLDQRADMAAMVAMELAAARVNREPGIAAVTTGNVTAARADQGRREPAPIEKHERLSAGIEVPANSKRQRFADAVGCW